MFSHDNVFTIYHIMKVRLNCVLMMLENDILFINDCVFVTYMIGNFEGCTIVKFHSLHTHGLEDTWLLVLTSHPHHSLPLAHYSNLNPNGFLYPLPDPPTQPCCILHQQFPLHKFFNTRFFTSTIQKGNKTCRFICCFFHFWFLKFIFHGKIGTPICK